MSRSAQRAKLVELATQIWLAFRLALPSLPQNTRAVLERRAVDSDMRWVLSLVLAAALAVRRGSRRRTPAGIAPLPRRNSTRPAMPRMVVLSGHPLRAGGDRPGAEQLGRAVQAHGAARLADQEVDLAVAVQIRRRQRPGHRQAERRR